MITQTGRDPLLEAMPIGFMGLDADWRITYINGAGEAVVGSCWDSPDGSLAPPTSWGGELMLGVDSAAPRTETVTPLTVGSTVLLFTDCLVERRDADLDSGTARLRAALTELAPLPLEELCDELVERLVQGRPEDDVALVALRLTGGQQ